MAFPNDSPGAAAASSWSTETNGRLRSAPKLSRLNLERSATPPTQPVSPLTPDFRSGGYSRSATPGSPHTVLSQRRSYSVPSVVLGATDNHTSYADIPPLPPVSKIQSRVRAHKARAILKQFQDEEEERLAEVHGLNAPRQRQQPGGPSSADAGFIRHSQSQTMPVSPLHSPSPSSPGFGARGSEYSLFSSRFASNRSRDDLLFSRAPTAGSSTPDLLRTTMYSISPGVSREHLEITTMPAEIEGDEYFHSELPTEGAEVMELNGAPEPVELGSSPPRKELSATLSVRQKPPRYRPPQFDYLDPDGVSKYNTLPGEAFPLITNASSRDPEELPSGDERAAPSARRPTLDTDDESNALRKSIEPETDPRTGRAMSNASK